MSLYEKLEMCQESQNIKCDSKSAEVKRLGKLVNKLQRKLHRKNRKSASQHRVIVKLLLLIADQSDQIRNAHEPTTPH